MKEGKPVEVPVAPAPSTPVPVVQAPVPQAPVVQAPVVQAPVVQAVGEDDVSPFGGGDEGVGAAGEAVVDLNETWVHLVNEVRRKRPLIRMWLEFGCLAEVAEGRAVVAFPPHQVLAMEQLDSPANRELMTEILTERLGRRMAVSVEVRDGAVSAPVQTQSVARSVPKTAEDVMAEFKADPLIRKALEIFKATLEADPV
jgi:hypothetical protein